MIGLLRRIFDPNPREIRRLEEYVAEINELETETAALTDEELKGKTALFRERLDNGATLDELLPEAFAAVREAGKRTLGMRHFDVQLVGGIALHEGRIAEMKTGEGKTLVATAPLYLNALAGKGAHLVTVNDYLAGRDAEWMGPIYRALGMTVGTIVHGKTFAERREAYMADITYGTNNEFGFDYLRDNMVRRREEMVQRDLYFAIVDEVDSILIDEARTPLIISGPGEQSTEHYFRFAQLVPRLKREEHYTVDEKAKTVALTEEGTARVESLLGIDSLVDEENFRLNHYVIQALKAMTLFQKDRDYVVHNGEVVIVDEFTGRLMFGRRYSDGLHQAIEAREGVRIERESQTLATITFQNYFRMYNKLAGMTGTAKTEEEEFRNIYGMDVLVIPTHRPMVREDNPDVVYKTEAAKFQAVVDDVADCHARQQPVLVGTVSIDTSERLSAELRKRGIPHNVLNAKHHDKEAEIVAQAGRKGAVTIATNMAGRGTDIVLGGNPETFARERMRKMRYTDAQIAAAVAAFEREQASPGTKDVDAAMSDDERKALADYREAMAEAQSELGAAQAEVLELGGLHIIGTERHESRRIDNQLRGRSGRQGDPGSSRFYVSLEDDLMRLFGSDRISGIMERLGWEEDMPIEHNQISRSIENAQKRVEARNFEARKQVLQFDDVMNKQREVIYGERRKVLTGANLRDNMLEMLSRAVSRALDACCDEKLHPEEWDYDALREQVADIVNKRPADVPVDADNVKDRADLQGKLESWAVSAYEAREDEFGAELMREIERHFLLQIMDIKWMEHLRGMDDLREGIHLRAHAQRDPLVEYQFEAYEMFQAMLESIQEEALQALFRVRVQGEHRPQEQAGADLLARATAHHGAESSQGERRPVQQRRVTRRIGRNEPCPCGSGKKYKRCCGA